MKNMKFWRTALVATLVLTVMLSVTGGTIAWFTDSVTSAENKIQAGNLDVDLFMHNGTEYVEITDAKEPIFGAANSTVAQNKNTDTLWEPGKTQVAYLKLQNNGNLALQYKVDLTVKNEVNNLADAMWYKIVPDAQNGALTAWDATGALQVKDGQQDVSEAVPMEPGATHYFALAIHMDEKAGNEYQGGSVEFDIKVEATQWTYEPDSFDNTYDAGAELAVHGAAVYAGVPYDTLALAVAAANENGGGLITLGKDHVIDATLEIAENITIDGNGYTVSRKDGFTGTVFSVSAGNKFTLGETVVDGGAVWTNTLADGAARTNSGVKATGNLVASSGNAVLVLDEGTVLKNNDGASAVSLATRGGGSLTVNGAEISYNTADGGGAIWGGDDITINEGSKINYNHATSIGGAVRMVDGQGMYEIIFTMNGGEMNHNTSAGTGGAIWGGNREKYYFNGGEMAYNYAVSAGGAIWTGYDEDYYFSGDFKLHDNSAGELGGAIRFSDYICSFTMTGGQVYNNTVNGKDDPFFLLNVSTSITGGSISDDFTYSGGVGLVIGEANIEGIISYDLSTNHNTAYLAEKFNSFKFTVNATASNFAQFNFKPAAGYTYTAGDEAKLVCLNEGYETYWDVATSTFRLRATN